MSQTIQALTQRQINQLHDQARAEAPALRREAVASFWQAACHWFAAAHPAASDAAPPRVPASPNDLSCAH